MRPKSLVLLLLALGCGLVAAIGVAQVLSTKGTPPPPARSDLTNVIVAKKDISLGSVVNSDLLTVEQWPHEMVRKGMITSLDQAQERRTRSTILAGMPLMENYLSARGERSSAGAAQLIPKGFRSVPVRVDVVSGGGSMIMPGDRVDVVVMVERGREFTTSITKTIVQDVRVFAVDDLFTLEKTEGQKSIQAQTISLVLTPEQTEKIMMASELGRIRLSLRNPDDTDVADLRGIEPEILLGAVASTNNREMENKLDEEQIRGMIEREIALQAAQANVAAVAPPPNQYVMRVIAGGEVSSVTLEWDDAPHSGMMASGNQTPDASSGGFSIWSMMPSYGKGNAPVSSGEEVRNDRETSSSKDSPPREVSPAGDFDLTFDRFDDDWMARE